MNEQNTKRKWAVAFGHLGFIYATLSAVPIPLLWLRSHNMLRLTIATVFLACFLIVLSIMHFRTRNWKRFAFLFALAALYGWLTTLVKRPEEQIHFIQYGLVGVLFARALQDHLGRSTKTDAIAFSIAMLAGWVDELIQGQLPNRHYDVRDLYLNAVSAFLGLVVYRTIPPRNQEKLTWR